MTAKKKTAKKATRKGAGKKTAAKNAARKKAAKKAASKKAASKKAAKKASAKKASKKAAPKKAAKKPTAKKAASNKAPAKKAAPAKDAPGSKKAATAKKAASKAKTAKKSGARKAGKKKEKKAVLPAGAGRPEAAANPLGNKWECFQCGAKFYDLNKEEAICPKCGANQAERPKTTSKPAPTDQPIRPTVRPMAPLLDDEEERPADDLDPEVQGVSTPRTGEEFFDDAAESGADDD